MLALVTVLGAVALASTACAARSEDEDVASAESDLTKKKVTPWDANVSLVECERDDGIKWTSLMSPAEAASRSACRRFRLPGVSRQGTFTEVEQTAPGSWLERTGPLGSWVRLRFDAYTQWEGDASLPEASEPTRVLFRDQRSDGCPQAIAEVTGTQADPSTHEVLMNVPAGASIRVLLGNAFRRVEPRIARRLFVSDVEILASSAPAGSTAVPPDACRQTVDGPDPLPEGFDPFSAASCTGRVLSRSKRVAMAGAKPFSNAWIADMDVYMRKATCTTAGCTYVNGPARMRSHDDDAVTSAVTLHTTTGTPRPYLIGTLDAVASFDLSGRCTGNVTCTPDSRGIYTCAGDLLAERGSFRRADGTHVDTCENPSTSLRSSWGSLDVRESCARLSFTVDKGGSTAWTRYEVAGVARY